MKKQLILLVFAIFSCMIFLVACGSVTEETAETEQNNVTETEPEQQLAKEINVFNWSESIPDEVIRGFEEEFGVKVNYSTFDSEQNMLAKVKSGLVPYDVTFPTAPFLVEMIESDMLYELDLANIPNFEYILDEWKDLPTDPGNKYSVPYNYGLTGIVYNKEKVETPTSWNDLWNPEYAGHVIALEDSMELMNMLLQSEGFDINNPTEDQLVQAGEKLKSLMPNLLTFSPAPSKLLASGEAWIGHSYCGEAGVAWETNKNIDCVMPKEGGLTWYSAIVVPKTSKNKYTAEVFINYLLRPEVSIKITEAYPYPNPNRGALELFSNEMKEVPGLFPEPEVIEKAELEREFTPEQLNILNRVIQEAKVQGN